MHRNLWAHLSEKGWYIYLLPYCNCIGKKNVQYVTDKMNGIVFSNYINALLKIFSHKYYGNWTNRITVMMTEKKTREKIYHMEYSLLVANL